MVKDHYYYYYYILVHLVMMQKCVQTKPRMKYNTNNDSCVDINIELYLPEPHHCKEYCAAIRSRFILFLYQSPTYF